MSSLRTAVLAAATCLAAVVAPPAHASSLLFTGIRPGTLLVFRSATVPHACTANFVFQTSGNTFDKSQQLYLGTAGHCGSRDEAVDAVYVPPGGGGTVTTHIGTVVFDAHPVDNGVIDDANDFMLIAIDPWLNDWVSPSMAWWGGPTGVRPAGGEKTLTWTGQGGGVGGTVPRVGQLMTSNTTLSATTVIAAGDSGSAVNTLGGLAVGSFTSVDTLSGVPTVVNANGVSISQMLTLGGHPLSTCASAQPWPLPGCPS